MNTKNIKLQPELEKAILDLGFSEFTEIQEKAIPIIQEGKDLIGQSHTGSGKTAAFGFPVLEKVVSRKGIQVLILVPTRELSDQVTKEFYKFSKYKPVNIVEVYGGVPIGPQMVKLNRADIAVCTPGRLLDHLRRGTINVSKVSMLVLDEADKMFEMGFVEDVKDIISYLPKNRQTLLFSATISKEVTDISNNYMKNPIKVKMPSYVDKSKLIQNFYRIDQRDKFSLLVNLLDHTKGLIIIFCATRRIVDELSKNLYKQKFKVQALHGGLSQNKRKQVMEDFHSNRLDILVASDIAARGLDIKNVQLVINYDIPKTSRDYVHRIGRTARAGSEGKIVSLITPRDEDNFRTVLEDRSLLVHQLKVPQFEKVFYVRNENRRNDNRRENRRPSSPRFSRRY